MLFRYSICHGCWQFFFPPFLFLYMSSKMCLLIPPAFLELSLLPLHTFCILVFRLKSSCSHQIKITMARHPFKNPLKALVTFQATCFFFLCVSFLIHLIEKKNQQNISYCKSIKSHCFWVSPCFLSGAEVMSAC